MRMMFASRTYVNKRPTYYANINFTYIVGFNSTPAIGRFLIVTITVPHVSLTPTISTSGWCAALTSFY